MVIHLMPVQQLHIASDIIIHCMNEHNVHIHQHTYRYQLLCLP